MNADKLGGNRASFTSIGVHRRVSAVLVMPFQDVFKPDAIARPRCNNTMFKMKERELAHFEEILKQHLSSLAESYQVHSLGIFGSYARQEHHPDSDLDVLVAFSETPGLLQFIALENYLSDLLGVKVDLVMQDALKPNIGQHILREVIHV